jgi:hypothetical protein
MVYFTAAFEYQQLSAALAGRDEVDIACPLCGPTRRTPTNRTRKVLRLWLGPGFISFHCARCGESGFIREDGRRPIDRDVLRRIQAERTEREQTEAAVQRHKALGLWRLRRPIPGSPPEIYLREVRAIRCELPATLGYLPPRDEYPPALIAAFGTPAEPEPGVLAIADKALRGVHLTRLKPDGSGKAEDDREPKIMIGRSKGAPIVLAPMNDLLGLVITEGIEDALSAYASTGLGAWAAGAASRLPALSATVPSYSDTVSVLADADPAGQRHAGELLRRLEARRCVAEVRIVNFGEGR